MFIEKENYFYIEEFEKYGITAVYTKKNAGNMSDYCPIENQEEGIQKKNREKLLKELGLSNKQKVMAFQTHSNNVKIIDENTEKYYYEKQDDIDGFLTKRKDIAIFTFYADCLPIFVYDKENQVIGVWHSGWPGTFKEMMKSGLLEMEKNNSLYKGKPMKELLKNTCIHFVPMVNPDGVSLVQNGIDGIGSEELKSAVLEMAKRDKATNLPSYFRLWKNNLAGVNLNKNFDANWEKTVDTKGYPSKDEYKGTAQESEIESKALADLQRKEKFSASISYHTQGEVIYWYFGEGSYVEEARKLAQTVNRNSGYTIVNSYSENHAGGFKDFMERKYNVPSVTIECGKGTSPVPEEQIDKIWKGQRGILPDLLWES